MQRLAASFEWLASMDLGSLFQQRPCLMKSVPGFMKGSYRAAMRVALNEFLEGGDCFWFFLGCSSTGRQGRERSRRFNCSEELNRLLVVSGASKLAQEQESACRGDQIFSHRRRRHARDDLEKLGSPSRGSSPDGELGRRSSCLWWNDF